MSRIRANQITNQSADGAPTVQNGLIISGVTTSTTFSGSGASLTNLPSAQLTGALPAISGANLTGLSLGITNAQQFRLAANQAGSGSAGTVLTNWQDAMTTYTAIGGNWSHSNGIFSCSATGIYLCHNQIQGMLTTLTYKFQLTQVLIILLGQERGGWLLLVLVIGTLPLKVLCLM